MEAELTLVLHDYQSSIRRRSGVIRLGLAVVLCLTVLIEPRSGTSVVSQLAVVMAYALICVAGLTLWYRPRTPRLAETCTILAGLIDVAVVVVLQVMSDGSPFLTLALFVVPVLAAFQIRLRITIAIIALAFGTCTLMLTLDSRLRERLLQEHAITAMAFLALLCLACAWLAQVQFSRAREIVFLSEDRARLLSQIMSVEERERAALAEELHDGPLQSVLAARFDLNEVLRTQNMERVSEARDLLLEISRRLRDTTSALHPSVLEATGLPDALRMLVDSTARRSGMKPQCSIFYVGASRRHEAIVFGAARELLSNVVRHSEATDFSVSLSQTDTELVLDVTDNGHGMDAEAARRRHAEGHIGLASHRVRIESAGGRLEFPVTPTGTHVRVSLPTLTDEAVRNRHLVTSSIR
ncbi:sensor histidine kinase [Streptomyces sp. NPDC059985]|uniref:sensor histidine kinase n=1 Tax=Streptomyces sp. NPDC059985 TaxID=3347025 RepID=UPI0036AB9F0D